MSAYRQNFTPAAVQARPARRTAALIVAAAALLALSCARVAQTDAAALPFPPAPPAIDAGTLAQIRVEAFRAGMAAGIEQGCSAPGLGTPIGAK